MRVEKVCKIIFLYIIAEHTEEEKYTRESPFPFQISRKFMTTVSVAAN